MITMLDAWTAMLRSEARLARSSAARALVAATVRDRDEARAKLADMAAEAALAGNPPRARYYDEWGART